VYLNNRTRGRNGKRGGTGTKKKFVGNPRPGGARKKCPSLGNVRADNPIGEWEERNKWGFKKVRKAGRGKERGIKLNSRESKRTTRTSGDKKEGKREGEIIRANLNKRLGGGEGASSRFSRAKRKTGKKNLAECTG